MKKKMTASSLRMNQTGPILSPHGPCQPEKKSVTSSALSVIMFTYSAIWKRPKRMPLYSVWYPATSSCSASGRSNGARLVSAIPATKKVRKPTNCGTTNGISTPWRCTISVSDSDRPSSTTPRTLSASDTSYETSCAHVRIEPSSEYFDSDAQPPTMNP